MFASERAKQLNGRAVELIRVQKFYPLKFLSTSSIMASSTAEDTLAHVNRLWFINKNNSPIYGFLLSDVSIETATKGIVRARLTLSKNHVNSKGGLHGTVSACIVDWIGGLAIASHDLREKTGVSTDIHVTYQSSAKEGDILVIEGQADKVGGTLAFTTVTIWKLVDSSPGPVVAKGSHTKYVK